MPDLAMNDLLRFVPKDDINQDLEEDCSQHDALLYMNNNGYLQAIERTIRSTRRKYHAPMPGVFQAEYNFLISAYFGSEKRLDQRRPSLLF